MEHLCVCFRVCVCVLECVCVCFRVCVCDSESERKREIWSTCVRVNVCVSE